MSLKFLQLAVFAAVLGVSAGARSAVVFSEDFSSGLTTGTTTGTDYGLTSAGVFTVPGANGVYRVVSNPANPTFTNNYTSFYDHTSGTSEGAMMFFDGSPSGDRIFYRSANLVAGSSYTFSFYVASDNTLNTPSVYATINGVTVGGVANSTNGVWTLSSTSFVAQSSGLATFGIVDAQTIDNGNDGALDDILLIGPDATNAPTGVPEPQAGALLALGLVAAAAARRRRVAR